MGATFDDQYFTSVDTASYFTANGDKSLYNALQGLYIGESSNPAISPIQATNLAINHGLTTFMIPLWAPPKQPNQQKMATSVDLFSQQQQRAIGELLAVNKMNLTVHAPIVDIMGVSDSRGNPRLDPAESSKNINILKISLKQTDNIAKNAGLKNVPFCIHTTNGIGSVEEKFDSGFRTKDGKVIYGTKGLMVDINTGQIIPADSKFQFMNINQANLRGYKKIEGTETADGTMALFEIPPETHISIQNNTALNENYKKLAELEERKNQLLAQGVSSGDPMIQALQSSINTIKSEIQHLESPYFGTGQLKRQFVDIRDYAKKVVPERLAELAMESLENTETHPVIAVENEPQWQLGSNPNLLIEWVDKGREKFAQKLIEKGWNPQDAKKKAEEMIGITLDTGHLNTLKTQIGPDGKPYTDKELKEMVERMAKKGVKLVHIADNIGELGQDSHLLIGRGNAKINDYLEILKKNGFKGQAQFEAFEKEMDVEKMATMWNLMGANVPMYSNRPSPRFTDIELNPSYMYTMRNTNYGHTLPQIHFGMWGGPFAGLQSTFSAAPSKDKFSGAPTE